MELAVILVLCVLVELALTFYFLGRLREYKRTLNELVNEMANIEHGLDQALTSLGMAKNRLDGVANDLENSPTSDILAAAKAAESATPDEIAQAKKILETLGVKLED